jgi:hypothetical protein
VIQVPTIMKLWFVATVLLALLTAVVRADEAREPVRYCPDMTELVTPALPADERLTGHDKQALWVPCDQLPREDRV